MNDDEIRTPKRIYLQIDNGSDLPTTWSDDSIYDTDIEYIRSDIQEVIYIPRGKRYDLLHSRVVMLKKADKTGASISPIDFELIALYESKESIREVAYKAFKKSIKRGRKITELQEKLKVAEEAIEWIKGACDIKNDRCLCGRPTGVMAIFHHAKKALSTIKGETE